MKKLLIYLILLFLSAPLFPDVNGVLREIDGIKVLIVWGTHQQRGYAHGYLLAENIKRERGIFPLPASKWNQTPEM